MLTQLQRRLSEYRDGTYGQFSDKEKETWREMMNRADEIIEQFRKEGRLDKSLPELLGEAAESAAQLRKALEEAESKKTT